jgi:predicted small lipoprotein YifL
MSDCSCTERPDRPAAARRLALALLALGLLAACGKRGSLRLPKPGETDDDQKAPPEAAPGAAPKAAQ